jgi:ABC-type multidrug transport system ATPase subunit
LRFYGGLFGVSVARSDARAAELAEALQVTGELDEPVMSLATGIRARFGVIRALLHQPRVLLLDEPSRSQDAVGRGLIDALLRRECEAGLSVLLVSHEPEEIASGDRSIVLEAGHFRSDT